MLRFDQRGPELHMPCPLCDMPCTHIGSATFDGVDALIGGSCEAGCEFTIRFEQHKGDTYVSASGKVRDERLVEGHAMNEVESAFWLASWGIDFTTDGHPWGMRPQLEVVANGSNYRLDFGNPDTKIGIEIDGLAYHNGQDSFMRDRKRQRDLEIDGWRIIRFAAKEIMNDAGACAREASEQVQYFTTGARPVDPFAGVDTASMTPADLAALISKMTAP